VSGPLIPPTLKAPRVSILLPTFNRRDLIRCAIESALAQTLEDFELLVSGDGCTDGTGDVVQRYGDPRIVWFDWPKMPTFGYANRNRALRQARGTFIAYLPDDDLWLPDHLERLTACLDEHGAEWGYSRPLDVSVAGRITPQVFNLHDPRTRHAWQTQHIGYLSAANVVHRRSCLERYGYWSEEVARGGDWELWMRILAGGGWRNFGYEPTPTSLHFVAAWRRGGVAWRKQLWRRVRAWEGAEAPELTVPVPEGIPEQQAVWLACQRAPDDWVRNLRRAAQVDLDRRASLAWPLSQAIEAGFWSFRRLTTGRKQFVRLAE